MFKNNLNLHNVIEVMQKPVTAMNNQLQYASIAFIMCIFIILCILLAYRKQVRKIINYRIAFPLVGVLILVIPFIEDYSSLFLQHNFLSSFNSSLIDGQITAKFVIYFVACSFIFNNKSMISTITPLAFIVLSVSIISKHASFYAINVIEYSLVLASLVLALALTKKRYSFISFMDSSALTLTFTLAVHFTQVLSIRKLGDGDLSSFKDLGNYLIGWTEIISSLFAIIAMQFVYLFASTKMVFKVGFKDTWELIKLEDKYRKANIDLNLDANDDFTKGIELRETEVIDLQTDVLFKSEVQEIEFDQQAKVQKIQIKAKGIRSPSFS